MKLVWSPERASKAYISAVKLCTNSQHSGVAEFLSAMAAGWDAKMIVETWAHGCPIAASLGLAVAAGYTGGRHVCVVPDERSRSEYVKSIAAAEGNTEVIVAEAAEKGVSRLEGVDFLVVDCRRGDFARVLRCARLGSNGAVLARKNACLRSSVSVSGFRWSGVLARGTRVVRSVILPVGEGLDIAYTGQGAGSCGGGPVGSRKGNRRRWIEHVDQKSGEAHIFRR